VVQAIVVIAIAIGFFFYQGRFFAISVIVGGVLCVLPNLLFARWWFAYYSASATARLVKVFYLGELAKLCSIGVLFLLVIKFLSVSLLGCLIGFICAQIAFWVASLVRK